MIGTGWRLMRIGSRTSVGRLKVNRLTCERRPHTIDDVGIGHRRFEVNMVQEFLDGSNVVTAIE